MVIILEDVALKVIRETEMSSFQAADGIETDLSYFIFYLLSFDHINVAGLYMSVKLIFLLVAFIQQLPQTRIISKRIIKASDN